LTLALLQTFSRPGPNLHRFPTKIKVYAEIVTTLVGLRFEPVPRRDFC
jgi:hypothetical protein